MRIDLGTVIILLLGLAIIIIPINYTQVVNPCSAILHYSQAQSIQYLKNNPQYKTTVEGYIDCQAADPVYVMIGGLAGILLILIGLFTPYLKSNQTVKCFQCKVLHDKEEGTDYHGSWICKDCLKELTYDK